MAPTFTKIAQRADRGPEESLSHELWISGRNYSESLISATVTYTTDVGGSGLEFSAMTDLEDFEDERMRLELGYGDKKVPYFTGKLTNAKDGEKSGIATAQGFGPFRLMAENDIGRSETFTNRTLENVVMDLSRRAGHGGGEIEIRGGRSYRVPPGEQFLFDTKCLDVMNTLLEKAEFVASDLPGGKRLVMPKPKPGANTGFDALYTPDNYTALTVDPTHAVTYHSVVVYRMGENNTPVVYAERDCVKTAPKGRRYIVSDFPGTQTEAEQKAYELAILLRAGERTFSMTTFFNPDINLWDGFKAVRLKKKQGKWWRYVYNCQVDSSISMSYAPGSNMMELQGSCYEIKSQRAPVSDDPLSPAVSPGVVRLTETSTDIRLSDTYNIVDSDIL